MKTRANDFLNVSVLETNYYNDNEDKIELVSCEAISNKCKKHLTLVNESYRLYTFYRKDKNFNYAIEVLKSAYLATFDLTESSCIKCGELFRSTILESLEGIHNELSYLSRGFLKRKRFQSNYKLAGNVLMELRELSKNPKPQLKNEIKHFIESYQKRNVS